MAYKINIAGDLAITYPYDGNNIKDDVVNLFLEADFNIVNLELPVTDSDDAIDKTGPNFKGCKESITDVLKVLGVDMVTLANNHTLDYGEVGMKDTLAFCDEIEVSTVGAGMNLAEAQCTAYKESSEGLIAFVNFCENEWTIATADSAGANPMDLIDNTRQIQEAKKKADFVIVIIHGGNEYNAYPSPRMVKQYRYYVDCGADTVISHHTHTVSGYEVYKGAPIAYSLGNFLFPRQKVMKPCWYNGLVASLTLEKGKEIELQITPILQHVENFSLSIANEETKENIVKTINDVNTALQDSDLLQQKWLNFVMAIEKSYIRHISPLGGIKNRYLNYFFRITGLYKILLHRNYLKEHLNRIRCEAHLDATRQILISQLSKTK